jgi:P-type Ca2+ transporter type 2C
MAQSQKNWYSLSREEALSKLESDKAGLSVQETQKRITVYGPNELKKQKGKSPLKLLLEQFTDVLMIILLVAIALSFVVGEPTDAAIILAIVIASAVLGFTQEYRSEKAVDALKKMTAPNANVLRGGRELKVPADQLVPGDIILLYTGDKVPADARILEAFALKVNEASLTGESTPTGKFSETIPERTSLNDRRNMVFMGTIITYGRGKAVVTETGMSTEFGKIAELVQTTPTEKTPLERRLSGVGKWIGIICITVALSVGAVGVLVEHRPIVDMILWAVSLAVAAVPEALPAIVTGALAIGMYRMAKVSTIVKRLPAVETLGSTSVICSDKTGTMTKGEMTVQKIYINHQTLKLTGIGYTPIGEFQRESESVSPDEHLKALLKSATLCNDSNLEKEEKTGTWIVKGDPTEGALVVAARKAGIIKEQLEGQESRIAEIPFSSERKRMTTIHETKGKKFAYMKGAPEVVLERCTKIFLDGKVQPLTKETIAENVEVMEAMAFQALRNLGFAFRELSSDTCEFDEALECDFVFLGLVGMIDPARPEVRDAIAICKDAGIRVVMITGDHKLTATAIGTELRLLGEKEDNLVLTGKELEDMTDEQLADVVEKVAVYARVSPEHKMRIVKAWKSKGEVVAMTGDGVNDAPALKMSDIGIAMGITGTEVTKDAADMVLADDNFASIVKAVKEGREIYDNIKKYLTYLLQCNIMEILVVFFAVVSIPYLARAFTPNPDIALVSSAGIALTAVQILWVNLVTDGLPAIALGVDVGDPDLMQRKPRKPKESLFSRDVKVYLSTMPIFIAVLLLTAFFARMPWESLSNLTDARTTLFTAMVMMELAAAISCRSLKFPILKVGPFKNKFLWIAVVSSFALQLLVLYAPGVQTLFNVQTPSVIDWGVAVLFAFVVFLTLETGKYVNSRRNSPQSFKTKSVPIKV